LLEGPFVRRLVVSFLVGSLALVGLALPGGASTTTLAKVTVVGAAGQEPTLQFSAPFSSKSSAHRQITAGTGDKLAKGAKATFVYAVFDGRTGAKLESSFGKTPVGVVLDKKQTLPGLVAALVGTTIGSRELVAIAPNEGLANNLASNHSGADVKKTDTLLFVVDVNGVRKPLKRATGTAVPPAAGLPRVKLASNGKPTITVAKGTAPTTLVVQPLVKGTGPVVKSGQTITVEYTGVIWDTGKKFDSSWDRGAPADFPIGVGGVIAGWDEGLVGQTVGSQVLLVVPPDKGYGPNGQPSGGIKGTDTLVFVVDILDAF
jgi:peptidylprolyl isomerase